MKRISYRLLPSRHHQLRLFSHTRRIVVVILPLGAVVGFMVALVLKGMDCLEPRVLGYGHRLHLELLLPAVGLGLATLWLHLTGIGEVSLTADVHKAHRDPYGAFPFRRSIGKVVACILTIAFGGSAGLEGPCKWFGAALGLQAHRAWSAIGQKLSYARLLVTKPETMVLGGASAGLAAVFRAPLTGALMAADHDGRLNASALAPCLLSAASSYLAFVTLHGFTPLLPLPHLYALRTRDLLWALLLGLACGLSAALYHKLNAVLLRLLGGLQLPWRGLVAGLGLLLLAMPAHFLWPEVAVTQGSGIDLVRHLLSGTPLSGQATAFLALKLAATALTFAGGGVGGLWLPSCAMGAALGAIFDGLLLHGQPGLMTLLGASAMAGATHRTLLVPVVFLAETTAQPALVVPALAASAVSYLVQEKR